MLFKNILMPFDGSEASAKATEYAIYISGLENSSITFIHILDNIKQGGAIGLRARYGDTKLINGFENARRKNALKWIEPIQERATAKGIKNNVEILEDKKNSKIETIVDFIEKNEVDLVVIGSRGLSRFKQMLVGSIASGIISHSKCPVLVIR
ncbi:MAG: universal stress protein [Candidatus Nitrosocosmicus sp.]|jgi:nucleotide-binding universal stress UspA family protein